MKSEITTRGKLAGGCFSENSSFVK